jgi:hypothetical protein
MFSGSWTSFHVGQLALGAEFRAQLNVNASASAVPIGRLDPLKRHKTALVPSAITLLNRNFEQGALAN